MNIGYIGASGLMGHGMAKNLLAKGQTLAITVHKQRDRVQDLLDAGARLSTSAADLGATCDVVFSDTNSLEAIVTATSVEGSDISYELTPAMTKEQVEKAVADLASAQSAKCEAGLDGTVGTTTNCEVTLDGQASKRIVEVAQVDPAKLGIELSVFMLLPKQQVQEVLMQKLSSDGTPVETVECVDDVASKVGSVVECVAVTGNEQQGYDVTVVEAEGDTVNFDYKAKP